MAKMTAAWFVHVLAEGEEDEVTPERPRTRLDCENGPRPCPWISCRHHLYLDVSQDGELHLIYPNVMPWELDRLAQTCSLDVAAKGEQSLEKIGSLLDLTRERIRQIEDATKEKLREHPDAKSMR